MPTLLSIGRKRETEFRIDLHSPVTGDVLSLAVIGSRQSSANLAALAYAVERPKIQAGAHSRSSASRPGRSKA